MPASVSGKQVVPLVLVLALAGTIFLTSRNAAVNEGVPVVRDQVEYEAAREKVRVEIEPLIKGKDPLVPFTEAEKEQARRILRQLDMMDRFSPNNLTPKFLAGRLQMGLEDSENAELALVDALELAERIPEVQRDQPTRATAAEAHYLLSLVTAGANRWTKALFHANQAVEFAPNSPDYLTARAAAELQLRDLDAAARDLAVALALQPDHKRANQLAGLIEGAIMDRAMQQNSAKKATP